MATPIEIVLVSGHSAPAATYSRQLLDGATKYGVCVQDAGRYLLKTAVFGQIPASVPTYYSY